MRSGVEWIGDGGGGGQEDGASERVDMRLDLGSSE